MAVKALRYYEQTNLSKLEIDAKSIKRNVSMKEGKKSIILTANKNNKSFWIHQESELQINE